VGLNGDIAHCRFWERPLSAGQIRQAALSANVPSNLRGGLTIELPLQQGTAVLDNLAASGGSSKATITGTLTASFGPPVGYTRDPGLFPPWLRVNTLGHNISVGIASETDSALAIAHAKLKAVGIASETDSALAITAKKARTIGIAQETDSAPSIIFTKAKLIGIAGETDSAPTITRSGHKITVTTASETDSAPGVGFTKQKAIGIASETDSALSVNRAKAKAIGIPVETDSALAIGHTRQRQIGIASEQDSALAVTRAGVTTTRRHGGLVVGVGIFVPEATPEET
jgi:hypothetical protein